MEKNNFCGCVLITGLLTCLYDASPAILYENSTCQNHDSPGTCTRLNQCQLASDQVDQYGAHNFTTCNFIGISELVCCPPSTSLRLVNGGTTKRKSVRACESYVQSFANIVFPHIAGGLKATYAEFPFMAALAFYSESEKVYWFKCGGSLISDRYVLTAAHCLWNSAEEEVRFVRLGIADVPDSVEEMDDAFDVKVSNATIHKNYTRRSSHSDIALLELEKPIQLRDDLRPACLFAKTDTYPEKFIITGWGAMNQNGRNHTILQKGFVDLVHSQKCSKRYARLNRDILGSQICAASNKSDVCVGDSGGPLLMRGSYMPVVVGVTSFGEPGCFVGRTSVYTSVADHLDWIEDIVWK